MCSRVNKINKLYFKNTHLSEKHFPKDLQRVVETEIHQPARSHLSKPLIILQILFKLIN